MSAKAGWYPDPGGGQGLFRYWDGKAWSAATSPNPSAPPPTQGLVGAGATPQSPAGGGGGLLGGILGGGGLASMLDIDRDGNPLDDILNMAGQAVHRTR